MEFRYGKQNWSTLERGEENCYLMTNGLGGFSSLSLIGSCVRNDQAVLMACLKSPNHRYNMLHRLEEQLSFGEKLCFLSSQDFIKKDRREEGFLVQDGFSFEDYPVWTYRVHGIEVIKKIALAQGENTVSILYEIRNGSKEAASLTVTPHMQFVPKGSLMPEDIKFTFEYLKEQNAEYDDCCAKIASKDVELYLRTNGIVKEVPIQICEELYYADDEKDGRNFIGRTAVNHRISMEVLPGQTSVLKMLYGTTQTQLDADEIFIQVQEYRKALADSAGFNTEPAKTLAVNANQFLSYRQSTDGWTILAGFPFFEDWGRDTMIAFTGCCLVTGQYEAAKSIMKTFALYCRKGLLPNLFPEGKEKPMYNTVDAALLFILAVHEYYTRTGDCAFVAEVMPVMSDIIRWYAEGTDYGIHMDNDGLLMAGEKYDQVTWMDVRIDDILPTPRHGKPVEINAYWYNALCIMENFSKAEEINAAMPVNNVDYGLMAARVKECFESVFWNEEAGCLKDVICGGPAENQIRCNQIWAVSLPYALLSHEKECRVVETVYEKLYTPWGLRTLDPEDAQYHGFYGGPQKERDMAYHQGTIWTFPLGGYYLAYLKVHDYSMEAKDMVRRQLKLMEPALWEGCIGQLAEIYDGDNPVKSKGCFAQAWSVGEILRVYDILDCADAQAGHQFSSKIGDT